MARTPQSEPVAALKLRKLKAETERAELLLEAARRENEIAEAEAAANLVYTFYDEVNADSVKECLDELGTWSRQSPKAPITIIFNSPGGSVTDGLALYDYLMSLRKRGHQLTIIALGEAASMGGVLLQAGTKRIVGRNLFMLIHQISYECYGKSAQHEDELKLVKRMEQKLLRILSHRATLSLKEVKAGWDRKDWWLDADEAVAHGFADEIL